VVRMFVKAKEWRKKKNEEILRSIEIGVSVLKRRKLKESEREYAKHIIKSMLDLV